MPRMTAGAAVVGLFFALSALAFSCQGEKPPSRQEGAREAQSSRPEPAAPREIQEPLVAGSFYPGDRVRLESMVRSMLDQARGGPEGRELFGLMVPHAGIIYSGPVAARAYRMAANARRFVILGPSHRVSLPGVFVLDKDAYRTPMGLIRIDRAGSARLRESLDFATDDERYYGAEHSLEVQLPFIQAVSGQDVEVALVMIGRISPDQVKTLALALDKAFDHDTVFVASTDMSHGNYPPFQGSDEIRPVDTRTLETIKAGDHETLARGIQDQTMPLCGGLPVLTLLELRRIRGGGDIETLAYGDSGDASGDHSKVVGYGAVAFWKTPGAESGESASSAGFTLSDEEKAELLAMARRAVESAVRGQDLAVAEPRSQKLRAQGAAFVTLKTGGELRGCIGSIIAAEPLYLCVQRRAVDAAIHDSRFVWNRLKPEDLDRVEIEVSVLTPPVPVKPDQVEVGRHGVLLTLGYARGVFLPQVPVEQGWDREQYLQNLCRKAGVGDPACYLDPMARIESFEAIVFSERNY